MKKSRVLGIILFLTPVLASSQTLFTYGNYKADATDFVRAFNKNNQELPVNKAKAMRIYLDAYINSRLKIRQAYDQHFDTLPQVVSEVENLRTQVIENYMTDPGAMEGLIKEAFQRSQKDIHAAHIFIAENADTVAMRKKLDDVLGRLQRGEDFLTVAQKFSDDPAAAQNKGDLGYLTVFTLPYEFEAIVYRTPAGKYASPYHSRAGYHIFKNLEERKALGQLKIQHILLAFPPGINEVGKKQIARLADSIYMRIKAGDNFGMLASVFSNDNISAAAEGNIPAVRIGQYEAAFEKMIWALPADGAVSKPFLTSYGYHIVKRIARIPVSSKMDDKTTHDELRTQVMSDDRWKTARDFIYTAVAKKAGYKKLYASEAVLWALSDSLLDYKPAGIARNMGIDAPLFSIGDTVFRAADWIRYGQLNRYKTDRSGLKSYPVLMDEFTKNEMYQYYRDHLETFNDEFAVQMSEFKDGNLFFEIMQQEVWNKAAADSAALLALYQKNKSNYDWKPSAEAAIFFCSDAVAAKTLSDQLKKNPANWKRMVESMSEKVVMDSGRYEWPQLPGLDNTLPKAGMVTPIVVNENDKTATFAYILEVHTASSSRTFEQAKGLVMNDYQALLEEQWTKQLREKYPVVVDEKVFGSISR